MFLLWPVTLPHRPHLCHYSETVRVLNPTVVWPRYSQQVSPNITLNDNSYLSRLYRTLSWTLCQIWLFSFQSQFPLRGSYCSEFRAWVTSQHGLLWKPQPTWALPSRVPPQCLPLLVSTRSPAAAAAAASLSPANPAHPPPVAALCLGLLPLLGQVGPHAVKLPSPCAGNHSQFFLLYFCECITVHSLMGFSSRMYCLLL